MADGWVVGFGIGRSVFCPHFIFVKLVVLTVNL